MARPPLTPSPSPEFLREVEARLDRAPLPLEVEVLARLAVEAQDAETLRSSEGAEAAEFPGEWVMALGSSANEAWRRLMELRAGAVGFAPMDGEAREATEGFALGAGLPGLEAEGGSGTALVLGVRKEPMPLELGRILVRLDGRAETEMGLGAQARALAELDLIPADPAAVVAWAHAHGIALELALGPDPSRDWGYALAPQGWESTLPARLAPWGIRGVFAGQLNAEGRIRLIQGDALILDLPVAFELGSLPDPWPIPEPDPAPRAASLPEDLGEDELEPWFLKIAQALPLSHRSEATIFPQAEAESAVLSGAWNPRGSGGDPFWGCATRVAEAAQGLACSGAEALGVALALPLEAPSAMMLGLRQGCVSLDLPVLEVQRLSGLTAPQVMALGTLEAGAGLVDVTAPEARGLLGVGPRTCGGAYRQAFDGLLLLGSRRGDLGGSHILEARGGWDAEPEPWLDEALRLQACVREGVRLGLFRSAGGVGRGGLLMAALDGSRASGLGCQLLLSREGGRMDALCFGEAPGRVLVTVGSEGEGAARTLARTHRIPMVKVGVIGGPRFCVAVDGVPCVDAALAELLSAE